MALDNTSYAYALKELYPDDVMRDLCYEDNPFYGLVPKDENATGKTITIPMVYGDSTGGSATFSDALANVKQHAGVEFSLTRVTDYSVAHINRETMLASRGDAGAFVEAAELEVDKAINNSVRSIAKQLYQDGHGHQAQIASVTSANPMVITLSDINDISNFELNMTLIADNTETGASPRATPSEVVVAGIDRSSGTITTDYDNSGGTTVWAASDYLFRDGDESATASGLAAWIPATVTSTAFFGVDRTADSDRLGGSRVTGTGLGIEIALLKTASKICREGGKPDCAFINPVQYFELIQTLGGKVEYVEQGVTASVYFSGVRIWSPKGPLEVYPDQNCPSKIGYVLKENSWTLYSVDMAPHIADLDTDVERLRVYNSDSLEVRIAAYFNLGCKEPRANGRVSLDAATF